MKSVSVLSTQRNKAAAAAEVVDRVVSAMGTEPADLAVIFCSPDLADTLPIVSERLRAAHVARHVIGCTAETVVGEDREIEGDPALSVWAIRLPGVTLTPHRLTFEDGKIAGWVPPASFGSNPPKALPTLLVLGDPFSFPPDPFLKRVNQDAPGVIVCGGMASGSPTAGGNRLLLDNEVVKDGAVAIEVSGPVTLRTVVSQGCRPIGRTLIVTKAEQSLIRELGRRPALEVLREIFDELDADDQQRVQQGLHIGRVINEYQDSFQRGDFLVRNVLGADDSGGIAITDVIRVGQTIQFHVRDAESADEDLRTLLENERIARPSAQILGALLFSCNGRGTRLFAEPNHDVKTIHDVLGPVPTAGFFAMGELGPVGGQNFVHGYTASVVLFEEE